MQSDRVLVTEVEGGYYEPALSLRLGRCAKIAYEGAEAATSSLEALGYSAPVFFSRRDTQAVLAVNHGEREIVLAFRGTEASLTDFWTDLRFWKKGERSSFRLHSGFSTGLEPVWRTEKYGRQGVSEALLELQREYPDYDLYFTGHSLGGALALVAAYRSLDEGLRVSAVYTFGGPRVFNRALATHMRTRMRILRVVNSVDVVPRVPLVAMGYRHVGALYQVLPGGGSRAFPANLSGIRAAWAWLSGLARYTLQFWRLYAWIFGTILVLRFVVLGSPGHLSEEEATQLGVAMVIASFALPMISVRLPKWLRRVIELRMLADHGSAHYVEELDRRKAEKPWRAWSDVARDETSDDSALDVSGRAA